MSLFFSGLACDAVLGSSFVEHFNFPAHLTTSSSSSCANYLHSCTKYSPSVTSLSGHAPPTRPRAGHTPSTDFVTFCASSAISFASYVTPATTHAMFFTTANFFTSYASPAGTVASNTFAATSFANCFAPTPSFASHTPTTTSLAGYTPSAKLLARCTC